MRNPNGYGSVIKLSGNRRRPYWVRKTKGFDSKGHPIYVTIGYATTQEEGNIMLAEANRNPYNLDLANITLDELFKLWLKNKAPKLGTANRASLRSAYNHCLALSNIPYRQIKAYQMQDTIDNCHLSSNTKANIKNLWRHLDKFAIDIDLHANLYAQNLTSPPIPETSRNRFSDEEINIVWDHESEPWVDTILILIYSGWRISELLGMKKTDIDLNVCTMCGGIKTESGKNRIVPIHSLIKPYVAKRMAEQGEYLISCDGKRCSYYHYDKQWTEIMERLGIEKTPHECRHTFESLLDSAGANRKCIDLMMGHKSKDTGNRTYNHKTLNELKENIELVTK